MLPLYDTVRSRIFPLINLTLVLANVLAFLYELHLDPAVLEGVIFTWGLIPTQLVSDPSSTWTRFPCHLGEDTATLPGRLRRPGGSSPARRRG